MRGVFVAGTGTGVGKTVVAAGILRMLRNSGINAAPMKPVQTGCPEFGGKLVAPDLDFALNAAGMQSDNADKELMCTYRFAPACSPYLAARLAGKDIAIPNILRCAAKLAEEYNYLVVEGAGGIMVPLAENETILDLIASLGFPVVVAAEARLGTINHTLLTLAALRGAGIEVAGVIVNHRDPAETCAEIVKDNIEEIIRRGKTAVLGVIGNIGFDRGADWGVFESGAAGLSHWIAVEAERA